MKDNSTPSRHHNSLQEGEKKIEKYIFSMHKIIGKGSYANVYLGRRITDDLPTAIKVIDKKIFANTYNIKSIQSEIEIMKKVDHQNIVKLLDVYQTNNNMYIVTQFCEEGDLRNYIKRKKKVSEPAAIKILRDITTGFKYLHERQIIHRDLKPANILVSGGVCKISDFGFAKNLQYGESTVLKSIVGTPLYMSPQILNKETYTNKSDLWSVGLIFYEMIYGHTPWPANNELQLLNNIMTRSVPFDSNISTQSKDFIKKCLKIKQEDRMSWEQAFKHPLLTEDKYIEKDRQDIINVSNKENKYQSIRSKSKSAKKRSTQTKNNTTNKTPAKLGGVSPSRYTRNITPTRTPRTNNKNTTPQRSPWRF